MKQSETTAAPPTPEPVCSICGKSERELCADALPLIWNPSGHTCGWCDYRILPIRPATPEAT